MKKTFITIVIILILIIIYQSLQIIRLENYHYAVQVGLCSDMDDFIKKDDCLNNTKTRTNPIYNLLYGLKIF